jgi:hypothetical protein
MTVFDDAFKQGFAAPFADTYQFKNPEGALFEIAGIFDANQVTDKVSGVLVKHTVCTLEFDSTYIDQLDIKMNSIFVIGGKNYRVTAKPFVDGIGWARCDLVLTS